MRSSLGRLCASHNGEKVERAIPHDKAVEALCKEAGQQVLALDMR